MFSYVLNSTDKNQYYPKHSNKEKKRKEKECIAVFLILFRDIFGGVQNDGRHNQTQQLRKLQSNPWNQSHYQAGTCLNFVRSGKSVSSHRVMKICGLK